jgi:hypothetical protein
MQVLAVPNVIRQNVTITALYKSFDGKLRFFGELHSLIKITKPELIQINPASRYQYRTRINGKEEKILWYIFPIKCPCCSQDTYNLN